MNLLHLDSSILGQNSASRELSAATVARLRDQIPGLQVSYRDLATAGPKHLDGASLAKADADEAALGEELLQEFLSADLLVLGVPMYNFNIPSQLKAWIDRIAVAGRSFRYTAQGPEGLAKAQRVIVAGAYGGAHPAGGPSNFIEPYLRFMFGFLGIADVEFITAEGLAISPEQRAQSLAAAHARIASGALEQRLPLAA